ncbi:MAG: hypothetical protein SPF89_11325 [Sphaerochaetaceae bacterium]|nr:hypothetical protein [Spirochaetales bacterium]MDY5500687.1 hypothetical protein [Sphaerochaetaceae bacterium]
MMRNLWKKALFLLPALAMASMGPACADANEASSSLVFKAFRRPLTTMSLGDFTLTIEPYSTSGADSQGMWNVTDALADSAAATSDGATVMNPVGVFTWALDCTVGSSSSATIASTIKVTFALSGRLVNSTLSSQDVGYTMRITAETPEMLLNSRPVSDMGMDTIDYSSSYYYSDTLRGYKGSVSIRSGWWSSTTYDLFDAISLDGTPISSSNADSSSSTYFFDLDSDSKKTGSLEFTPYYSSNGRRWRLLSSMRTPYTIKRGGTGYLLLDKAGYEAAQSVAGRYQATITVTIETDV